MSNPSNSSTGKPLAGWLIFGGTAAACFALGLLASSITERRAESIQTRVQFMTPISEWESDNKVWGQSFPREFNSWEATKDMKDNSKYGGSGFRDYLAEDPRLVVMWAGYPFAKDFNQARGHHHAVEDVAGTKRIDEKSPATCWTCKSPDVPRLMAKMGPDKFYASKFSDFQKEVVNPIGCADCHDNKTMALRISRPALKEAYERQGKDITKASHQEMRSLVCAQCHVEYYFKGKKEKYLTFPWDKGMKADQMEDYYFNGSDHVDWTHAISGAKMIKMQHPDFEVFSQGIHAARGVSCSDCHMPYKSEGGIKFTDHQIQSPLYNIQNSCQVCHKWSEKDVKDRVYGIQDKNRELLNTAQQALAQAHLEIGEVKAKGATDAELEGPRVKVSKSQMYWDYIAASNGMGFHAPQESARILGKSINLAQEARIDVNVLAAKKRIALNLPTIKSKDEAQAYIKPFVDRAKAAAKAKEDAEKAAAATKGS
jgi:nitrite reductase (cytochrome c-552)